MLAGTAPWTARLWTGRTIAAAAGGVLTRKPSDRSKFQRRKKGGDPRVDRGQEVD